MGKKGAGNAKGAMRAKVKARRVNCNSAAARGATAAAAKGQSGRNKKQGSCSNGRREKPASGSSGGSQKMVRARHTTAAAVNRVHGTRGRREVRGSCPMEEAAHSQT